MPLNARELQLENVSLSEKVYEMLKESILRGRLSPGEKLDIFELAKILKVSRTPIKEAFNRLSTDGLIRIYPNRGTFVRELPNAQEVQNIFDARLMVELWCCEQVSKAPEIVERAETAVHCCDPLFGPPAEDFDYATFFQHDIKFHDAIVAAAKNPMVNNMYALLALNIRIIRIYWGRAFSRAFASHQEHLKVLEALKERNYDKAKEALRSHIENTRDDMISILKGDAKSDAERILA
jgi:DNA-binding GntR family transcriptional regulator